MLICLTSYIFLKLFKSFRYQNKNCADMVNTRWCIVCISIHQSIHLFYPSSICSPSSRRTCVGINKHFSPSPLRKPINFDFSYHKVLYDRDLIQDVCRCEDGCGCANISIYIYRYILRTPYNDCCISPKYILPVLVEPTTSVLKAHNEMNSGTGHDR